MVDFLPVKRIKRAEIRYFEKDRNACEIPDIKAYSYFLKLDGEYLNIFHPFEECNVYERVPYTNSTKSGESFGTKMVLASGNIEDGVCYVLEKTDEQISDEDFISIEELQNKIVDMNDFIVDRISILENKDFKINFVKRLVKIKQDQKKLKDLQDYIVSKEKEKILKKI
ncbi:MAG: hypothetical protein IJ097_01320 [Bacilli bacterium]|nr:hypothetical protein [Bacilli bacterium]